jgi:hypothetical protein
MTPLDHLVLAIHDGDIDVPFAGAARLLREAIERGLVITAPPVTWDGNERKYPAKITKAGITHLRKLGLVRPGESAG